MDAGPINLRVPKAKPGPLEYLKQWPLRLWIGGVLFFLYVPLMTLMVFSFNDSRRNIVWKGFTLDYYEKAMNNDSLIQAFINSMTIAFFCTILSVDSRRAGGGGAVAVSLSVQNAV